MQKLHEADRDFKFSESLPNSLFQKNREKFLTLFKSRVQSEQSKFAFFKGTDPLPMYNSDCEFYSYQEGFFFYLFGVVEESCYAALDLDNGKVTLFVPQNDELFKIWMTVLSKEDFQKKYDVDAEYINELPTWLLQTKPDVIYINNGINSDSGLPSWIPEDKHLTGYQVEKDTIYEILAESRVTKTDEEIEVMKWATKITVEGHIEVLKAVKPGMKEIVLESLFMAYCQQKYFCGRIQPYRAVVGCGPNAATLHYLDNDKYIKDGATMLVDQAHGVHHYCSDITSSFPSNGKFTHKQREIYEIVLKANRAVIAELRSGVSWIDMHLLAENIIIQGLKDLGILNGEVEEMQAGRVGYLFMPHGLGHLIGLDVHDVGGYLKNTPLRQTPPGLKNLRTARVMEKNTFITVEPGCYFRDYLFNGEFGDKLPIDTKYVNVEKVREYQQEVSGVRIEDVVLVTETGCENFSHDIPRTVEEIELCMSGQEWRKL